MNEDSTAKQKILALGPKTLLLIIGIAAVIGILWVTNPLRLHDEALMRSKVGEAILLAGGAAEGPVTDYFQKNKQWPADLSSVYDAARHAPGSAADEYGVDSRYVAKLTTLTTPDGGYGIVATMQPDLETDIAGKAVEIWSFDGGASWHCGPASRNPVDERFLPSSCRETQPGPP